MAGSLAMVLIAWFSYGSRQQVYKTWFLYESISYSGTTATTTACTTCYTTDHKYLMWRD